MGRESRLKTGQVVDSFLGINMFADTQILRIVVIPVHYSAVGGPDFHIAASDVNFPLAAVDEPDMPNTTVTIVLLRLHPGERMTGAYQFRYHHRDSVSPDDGLDLKRGRHFDKQGDPDAMIRGFVALVPTVGPPTILDVADLKVLDALNVFRARAMRVSGMTCNTTNNPQPPDGSTAEEVTEYLAYLDQRDDLDRSAEADAPDERRWRSGRVDASTAEQASRTLDLFVIGALAECGLAVVFGWPAPSAPCTFHDPVLPFKIHARTRPNIVHEMIVRDVDSSTDVFVKVAVAPSGEVDLVGWLPGHECRRGGRRQTYGGAVVWFVPNDALRDIGELVTLVETWRKVAEAPA